MTTSVEINACVFENGQAGIAGGGLYAIYGTQYLTNTNFTNCTSKTKGGTISISEPISTITNVKFVSLGIDGASSCAIWITGTMQIEFASFFDSSTSSEGVFQFSDKWDLMLSNSIFLNHEKRDTEKFVFLRIDGSVYGIKDVEFHLSVPSNNGYLITVPPLAKSDLYLTIQRVFDSSNVTTFSQIVCKDDTPVFMNISNPEIGVGTNGTDTNYCGISICCLTIAYVISNRHHVAPFSIALRTNITIPTPLTIPPELHTIKQNNIFHCSGTEAPFYVHNKLSLTLDGGQYDLNEQFHSAFMEIEEGSLEIQKVKFHFIRSDTLVSSGHSLTNQYPSAFIFQTADANKFLFQLSIANLVVSEPLIVFSGKHYITLNETNIENITNLSEDHALIQIRTSMLKIDNCSFSHIKSKQPLLSSTSTYLYVQMIRVRLLDCCSSAEAAVISLTGLAQINVSSCTFTRCVGAVSGVFLLTPSHPVWTLCLSECLFSFNTGSGEAGSDVHVNTDSNVTYNITASRTSSDYPQITAGPDYTAVHEFTESGDLIHVDQAGADTISCASDITPCKSFGFVVGFIPSDGNEYTIQSVGFFDTERSRVIKKTINIDGNERTVFELRETSTAFWIDSSIVHIKSASVTFFPAVESAVFASISVTELTLSHFRVQFNTSDKDSRLCVVQSDSMLWLFSMTMSFLHSIHGPVIFVNESSLDINDFRVDSISIAQTDGLVMAQCKKGNTYYLVKVFIRVITADELSTLFNFDLSGGGELILQQVNVVSTIPDNVRMLKVSMASSLVPPPHIIALEDISFRNTSGTFPGQDFLLVIPSADFNFKLDLDEDFLSDLGWDNLAYIYPGQDTPLSILPVYFSFTNQFYFDSTGYDYLGCGNVTSPCVSLDYVQTHHMLDTPTRFYYALNTAAITHPFYSTQQDLNVLGIEGGKLSIEGPALSYGQPAILCDYNMSFMELDLVVSPNYDDVDPVIFFVQSGLLIIDSVNILISSSRLEAVLIDVMAGALTVQNIALPLSPGTHRVEQCDAVIFFRNAAVALDVINMSTFTVGSQHFSNVMGSLNCSVTLTSLYSFNLSFDGDTAFHFESSSVVVKYCHFLNLSPKSTLFRFIGTAPEHTLTLSLVVIKSATVMLFPLISIHSLTSSVAINNLHISEVRAETPPEETACTLLSNRHQAALSSSLSSALSTNDQSPRPKGGAVFIDLADKATLAFSNSSFDNVHFSLNNSIGTVFIKQNSPNPHFTISNIRFSECYASEGDHLAVQFPSLERFKLGKFIRHWHLLSRQKNVVLLGSNETFYPLSDYVTLTPVEFTFSLCAAILAFLILLSILCFLPSFCVVLRCRSARSRGSLGKWSKCCGWCQPDYGAVEDNDLLLQYSLNQDKSGWGVPNDHIRYAPLDLIWSPTNPRPKKIAKERPTESIEKEPDLRRGRRKRKVEPENEVVSDSDLDSERFLLESSSSSEFI
ncbi:hypothetical protein BLNAU_1483 [Blattamonas nauphoetae]|uniref:Transmembrane protein n=1 Tax=Blattamonas nauphoetae TaxID=2049346 RepID=A0ABQ9YIG0_9EUKA|nr:hypothetical protein BLNAU_1483 [Blattamonas nauphoetae]